MCGGWGVGGVVVKYSGPGRSQCKGPRAGVMLVGFGTQSRPVWLEGGGQGGEW